MQRLLRQKCVAAIPRFLSSLRAALLGKLTESSACQEIPAFYGTGKFIVVVTREDFSFLLLPSFANNMVIYPVRNPNCSRDN
jgi:hypothetical protein